MYEYIPSLYPLTSVCYIPIISVDHIPIVSHLYPIIYPITWKCIPFYIPCSPIIVGYNPQIIDG